MKRKFYKKIVALILISSLIFPTTNVGATTKNDNVVKNDNYEIKTEAVSNVVKAEYELLDSSIESIKVTVYEDGRVVMDGTGPVRTKEEWIEYFGFTGEERNMDFPKKGCAVYFYYNHEQTELNAVDFYDFISHAEDYKYIEINNVLFISELLTMNYFENVEEVVFNTEDFMFPSGLDNLPSLKNIKLPSSLQEIGFFNPSLVLEEIIIPKKLVDSPRFESEIFLFDSEVKARVIIEDGVEEIPDYFLAGSHGVTEIILPDTVTSIGECAFAETNITSIELPTLLTSVGIEMFYNCNNLKVIFRDGTTKIPECALADSECITEIILPDTVTSIGECAFARTSITSITLPGSITSIDESVFEECENLKCINVNSTKDKWTDKGLTDFSTIQDTGVAINFLDENDNVKIEGYQISSSLGGSRVVGSVEPIINKKEVVKWGFVYSITEVNGISLNVTEDDMYVGSNNYYVQSLESTINGNLNVQMGDSETANYFVRTTLFVQGNTSEFTAKYKVRAYAVLEDGSYVYSKVTSYSVYDIADSLYKNKSMPTVNGHNYLYNNILKRVNTSYAELDYNWSNTLVKPE